MVSTQTANVQVQDRGNLQQNRSGMSRDNVGQVERWASLLAGGVTALFGVVRDIRRGKPSGVGVTLACLGSGILYRGASGHSFIYQALGIDTTGNNQSAESVRVEKVVTVNRSPEELSHFWTNLDAAQQSEFATTSSGNSLCCAASRDRKSTRLNSSHSQISYAVFCLKKKKKKKKITNKNAIIKNAD